MITVPELKPLLTVVALGTETFVIPVDLKALLISTRPVLNVTDVRLGILLNAPVLISRVRTGKVMEVSPTPAPTERVIKGARVYTNSPFR